MEPQSEGNADISENSCPAHTGTVIIVEVTSWEEARPNSQLWSCQKAKGEHKYVFVCLMAANDSSNEYQCLG